MYRVFGGVWAVGDVVVSAGRCIGEVGVVNGGEQFLLDVVVNGVAGVCVDDGVIERGAKMGVACVELCELKLDQLSSGILGM